MILFPLRLGQLPGTLVVPVPPYQALNPVFVYKNTIFLFLSFFKFFIDPESDITFIFTSDFLKL